MNRRGSSPSCRSVSHSASMAVEPGHQHSHAGIRRGTALEILLDADAQPQEIGAPRLAAGVDLEPERLVLPDEPVVDRLEAIEPVLPAELALQDGRVERLASQAAKNGVDPRRVLLRLRARANERECLRRVVDAAALRKVSRVLLCRLRELREPAVHLVHRRPADGHHLRHAIEVHGRHATEVRLDQHVGRRERRTRLAGAAPHHDADHLVRHVERGFEPVALGQRKAHVHRDDHVHAHCTREAHRQVVDQAAVHQQAPADLDGGEHARSRHARAQHRRQVARSEHDGLAGLEVSGERAKRCRQLVEIGHVADAQRRAAQHLRDFLALHQPERQHDALPRTEPECAPGQKTPIVLLAPEHEVAARRAIAQQVLPVEGVEDLGDLRAAQPGGVQPAHDRAHAGAGDCIDRNPHLLQRANDTDVRGATRPAAAQHEADARPLRGRHGRLLGRGCRKEMQRGERTSGQQQDSAQHGHRSRSSGRDTSKRPLHDGWRHDVG